MPFGRLFKGKPPEPQPEREPDEPPVEEQAVEDESVEESDVPPEWDATGEDLERSWRARASDALPGGGSTGSKRPEALYGEGNESGPTHYARASGCRITTPGDLTLIDCTMALGSVAIGYADERILRAAFTAAANGNVAGLAHVAEVELAERLCNLIPCAEQVRFLKSGADAVSASVRIARAATGRNVVVGSGYFGWHDWSGTTAGIPPGVQQDFRAVPFDDESALIAACRRAGNELAAVVIEPVVERMPSESWISTARKLCDELGGVLVFDEMKTGFRLARGGYQELSGVTPDLATFGKAMSNGFPLAAVVGKRDVMEAASRTWISSTLAGESIAIAAAMAVLDLYEGDDDVCAELARVGGAIKQGVESAVAASGIQGVSVEGLDAMWFLRFQDAEVESAFLEESVSQGVLFKRGAYNYAALAHDDEETIVEIERAASSSMVAVVDTVGE